VLLVVPRHMQAAFSVPPRCEVHWIRARWRWHPFLASVVFFPSLLAAARRFKPDVIRVHSPACLGLASLAVSRLTGIPTVGSFHHRFERFRGARLTEKHLLSRFSHVVTVSEFSRHQLVELDEALSAKSSVIYNGVSSQFGPRAETADWKQRLGLRPDEPLFVTAGALIARKNIEWLLRVMRAWAEAGNPGLLVVIGEGRERRRLLRSIHEQGLTDRVALWGAVDDETLVSVIRAADAFLSSSLMEGFGLAVAEALACGTPTLVSDRGALPEVVRHGRTGFVLPLDRGLEPWLEAMRQVVTDPDARRTMGAEAARDAAERFDWDRAATELTHVYEHVVRAVEGEVAIGV